MKEITTKNVLKAIEAEHCRNSWKYLSSLSSKERRKQLAEFDKSFAVWNNYWIESSKDQKFDIWKDS